MCRLYSLCTVILGPPTSTSGQVCEQHSVRDGRRGWLNHGTSISPFHGIDTTSTELQRYFTTTSLYKDRFRRVRGFFRLSLDHQCDCGWLIKAVAWARLFSGWSISKRRYRSSGWWRIFGRTLCSIVLLFWYEAAEALNVPSEEASLVDRYLFRRLQACRWDGNSRSAGKLYRRYNQSPYAGPNGPSVITKCCVVSLDW